MNLNEMNLLKLKKPELIIFDWDNTLVDVWSLIWQALNKTLVEFGHDRISLDRVKNEVQFSMRDSFPEVFGENWKKAAKLYYNYYSEIAKNLAPLPKSEELLVLLKKLNIQTAIISNKRGDILRSEVLSLNWNSHFKRVIGSGDATQDKPSTAPVKLLFSHIGSYNPENMWFIGDSEVDIKCADNIGCIPILFGERDGSKIKEKNLLKNCVLVSDHNEVIELLDHAV